MVTLLKEVLAVVGLGGTICLPNVDKVHVNLNPSRGFGGREGILVTYRGLSGGLI